MKGNMKRYIAVIASSIWLFICVIILIVSSVKVRYPSVTAGALEFIVFMAMIVPPTVCLTFSILNALKNNTGKRRILLWIAIIVFFFAFIKIYIIDSVNPVVSYTTDINNYLLVDDDISSKSSIIKSVFPESVIRNSSDVKYRYYRLSKDDFEIEVEYAIEKDFFEAEKIRCKVTYDDISDTFAEDKDENVFNVDVGNDSYTAIIKFNNENLTISYQLYHRR